MASVYGWTDGEIRSLPISRFMEYWLAIGPLEAEKSIDQINSVSFPKSKKAVRNKYLQKLKRIITGTIKRERKQVNSIEDVKNSIDQQILRSLRKG